MRVWLTCSLPMIVLFLASLLPGQDVDHQVSLNRGNDIAGNVSSLTKVPTGVILVKGAWSSASDGVMPLPEGGSVINGVFRNRYFGISYALPSGWIEKYKGPPPSDTGRYVMTQLIPGEAFKEAAPASILFTAQDMFVTPLPVSNATELVNYMKAHLQADYEVEISPTQTRIAGRTFIFFAYRSPVAQLHWYVLATQVRCHVVQIVLTSRDSALLKGLIQDMNQMELPVEADPIGGSGGGAVPVCIKDYAREENVITRVNPVLGEHRFNPVPVRIVIDTEGKVKHIHFLSAFDDQAKAITDALARWRFQQYERNGQPTEVETGILFGQPPRR